MGEKSRDTNMAVWTVLKNKIKQIEQSLVDADENPTID